MFALGQIEAFTDFTDDSCTMVDSPAHEVGGGALHFNFDFRNPAGEPAFRTLTAGTGEFHTFDRINLEFHAEKFVCITELAIILSEKINGTCHRPDHIVISD